MHKNNTYDYNPLYGKIMGMSNAGISNDHIADSLKIPVWKVIETQQIAYGRSLMYGRKNDRRDS